jgi:hypothetical protein
LPTFRIGALVILGKSEARFEKAGARRLQEEEHLTTTYKLNSYPLHFIRAISSPTQEPPEEEPDEEPEDEGSKRRSNH